MAKRNLLIGAVLLAIFAGAAFADVTGNWSGTVTMGDQEFPLSYTFKQDGATLTGTVTGPQGDPIPLKEGKIEGDKISFYVQVEGPNGSMKFVSQGTVKGEEIALTTKMDGSDDFPPMQSTLKKQK